ncbi:MAG: hypothetical protein ABL984_10380 [Pyrinomonadaceae bacterium]
MTEKKEENSKAVSHADKTTDDSVLVFQGLVGIAVWMSFGLLLEGLIAFRVPMYILDQVTRELFRLAHAHGTLLSLVLIAAGLCWRSGFIAPPRIAKLSLQIGALLMPVGFLLGGIGHYESDPSSLVFLAPLGGVMVIFGIVACAVSFKRN